jgi:D-aminopeptidase
VARTPFGDGRWRKSATSGTGACVEVAFVGADEVLVRDSKKPDGPVLRFDHAEWKAFLEGARSGEFDV